MKTMYNKSLIPIAQKLRKKMTKEERHIWYDFLKYHPVKFTRQKVLGYYIVDFYAPSLKMGIEIDGSHHYTEQGMLFDAKRAEFLKKNNIVLLHIPNEHITECFESTRARIEKFIQERLSQME